MVYEIFESKYVYGYFFLPTRTIKNMQLLSNINTQLSTFLILEIYNKFGQEYKIFEKYVCGNIIIKTKDFNCI